jgi:hypothetical protein
VDEHGPEQLPCIPMTAAAGFSFSSDAAPARRASAAASQSARRVRAASVNSLSAISRRPREKHRPAPGDGQERGDRAALFSPRRPGQRARLQPLFTLPNHGDRTCRALPAFESSEAPTAVRTQPCGSAAGPSISGSRYGVSEPAERHARSVVRAGRGSPTPRIHPI